MLNRNLSDLNNSTYDIASTSMNDVGNVAFLVIFAILISVGLSGNIATVLIIKFREKSHSSTYTVIAMLAAVDIVAICARAILLVEYFRFIEFQKWDLPVESIIILQVATFVTFVCSCIHVVILARLRYKLLTSPIEAMRISPKQVVFQCLVAWGISCILGIPYGINLFLIDAYIGDLIEVINGVWICLCTIIPIMVFHILKTQKLRAGITIRPQIIQTLNKMVISICLLQIISTTSIATVLVVELVTQTRSIYNTWIGHLLMLTSHVLHPVLFFHFTFCHRFCRPTVSFRVSTNHNMDTRM